MTLVFVDPTHELTPLRRPLAARPPRFDGVATLLDISKPRGDVFLAQLAGRLRATFPSLAVQTRTKPTYMRVAPPELREEIRSVSSFVVEALAD
jgi:hypothetical protein